MWCSFCNIIKISKITGSGVKIIGVFAKLLASAVPAMILGRLVAHLIGGMPHIIILIVAGGIALLGFASLGYALGVVDIEVIKTIKFRRKKGPS